MNEKHLLLEQRLAEVTAQLRDQEARIPPHSIRPHQIEELERLEEERDRLKKELSEL